MLEIIVIISFFTTFVWMIGEKYKLPQHYEELRGNIKKDSTLDKILPDQFCLLCFLTQTSLVFTFTIAVVQHLPLLSIPILTMGATVVSSYIISKIYEYHR
jgi:hypothetical protein